MWLAASAGATTGTPRAVAAVASEPATAPTEASGNLGTRKTLRKTGQSYYRPLQGAARESSPVPRRTTREGLILLIFLGVSSTLLDGGRPLLQFDLLLLRIILNMDVALTTIPAPLAPAPTLPRPH